MKITLGCLYPDIMSTYGDRGNVATIRRRCEWRGIAVDLRELRLGDRTEPDDLDLIIIGSGGESQQRLVHFDDFGRAAPILAQQNQNFLVEIELALASDRECSGGDLTRPGGEL